MMPDKLIPDKWRGNPKVRIIGKAMLAAMMAIGIIGIMLSQPPQNATPVRNVTVYNNHSMSFEYNGEKWFVKFPENVLPSTRPIYYMRDNAKVVFKNGKPVCVWLEIVDLDTKYIHWARIPVLDSYSVRTGECTESCQNNKK